VGENKVLSTLIEIENCKHPGINIQGFLIDADDIIIEERVKMNCFYCGKYKNNWKCPPNIPNIDVKTLFKEYEHIAMIYVTLLLDNKNFEEIRSESSIILHRALLDCEKSLWEMNNSTAISFIGGSCKLCKNGCGTERCNNPYLARSPVEALGINIIDSIKKYGLDIMFPPKKEITRVGMLLW